MASDQGDHCCAEMEKLFPQPHRKEKYLNVHVPPAYPPHLYINDSDGEVEVPIAFCPFCGINLKMPAAQTPV